jgi:lipoprotein LpqH
VVKRGFVVAVAGVAIVVAGLAGCSSKKSCSGGTCVSGGTGSAKVTVDGKDQSVSGKIACGTSGNTVTMTVGDPTAQNSVTAQVTTDNPPKVNTVHIGAANTQGLSMGPGVGDATATKDGNKYKITGHVGSVDVSNPMAGMQTKPFDMEISCP